MSDYKNFQERFKLLVRKNPHLVVMTLSNIFTMRLIGNKTHGDLAEIGITEFINQFMYDFRSKHVGKDLFRAKEHEEDIVITDELSHTTFPVSLKAYGDGPLQLSTDKHFKMFPYLKELGQSDLTSKKQIAAVFASDAFKEFGLINVMPLIYRESKKQCNIMVFDYEAVRKNTTTIKRVSRGNGRLHPIYVFLDNEGNYICEVRYGNATANALQRGLWTHTKNAISYFDSLTNGWIDYSHNHTLVELFSLALVASEEGHKEANDILKKDIERLKKM
jgi:hypothetical protein